MIAAHFNHLAFVHMHAAAIPVAIDLDLALLLGICVVAAIFFTIMKGN